MKPARKIQFLILTVLSILPLGLRSETYLGLNISTPLLLSGTAGIYLDSPTEVGGQPLRAALEGELGVGGGKILIGFDSIGEGFGLGLKGSLLRTWFEPVGTEKDTTYLGLELQGSFQSLVLSLGGYRRVEGDGDGWIGTLSLGFRF